MKKQSDIEETETSTYEDSSQENSTTTEKVSGYEQTNNATSTATSTPGVSEPPRTFPVGVLPLTMINIFGANFRQMKKKISIYLLVLSLPTIFINVLALTILSGKDILGLIGFWSFFNLNAGLSRLVLLVPLVVFPLSILHYRSRKTVYKVWLGYSALALVVFIHFVIYAEAHPGDWLMPAVFILLGIAYIAGSIIIWLYGAIAHFFIKKK